MANSLEAAFGRQLKKHFPDDEDNSDEDFEEELIKKSKKKAKEMPKQKRPGYYVDNFARDQSGMNRSSPNPPQLQNMAQAMPSMQPFFPNHLPSMNHMTGRGMMPPGHPSRFSYPPTAAHFGPDGRPVYPPQFYPNTFNRGIPQYGMTSHPQFNQFPHVANQMASQMARSQGMPGYPRANAMMQGRMPFPPNARETKAEGYKQPETEQPISPQLSAPVSTSGEVTPSSETSDQPEPEITGRPESLDQRTSEAITRPGPHIRPQPFEQRPPETKPGAPARPNNFGQQLPVAYARPHVGPQNYFDPRSGVPVALQPRPDGVMQRMPGPPRGGMPFDGVARPYQHNVSHGQRPGLKQGPSQNRVPTQVQGPSRDQQMPWPPRSTAEIGLDKQQGVMLSRSVDQKRGQSTTSPIRKRESEEDEVPFPFIIRSGQNKRSEDESPSRDDTERGRERLGLSSSSENEQAELEKEPPPRKPLGFQVSQLLNNPVVSRSENAAREPVISRPGGQPSVIKSTAAATPSPSTLHSLTRENRGLNSEQPRTSRAEPGRTFPGMEASRNPSMYKDWPGAALGGDTPRSFLEELNGDDLPPPRGLPEFSHGERPGADPQNHRLPFTSLLKEMAPPPMSNSVDTRMYGKPREADRTEVRYSKTYTDRDSARESYGPSRNQLHNPQEDPRHSNPQAAYGHGVYGSEKRAPNAIPPLYRASNGANQELSSGGRPKDFPPAAAAAGSNSVQPPSERQLIDLDNVQYRRAMYQPTEGHYNREALYLANQRRQQQQQAQTQAQNIPPSMSHIFPAPPGAQSSPMMSYSAMLRQQQLFEAAYASHMVRNGEYPMSRVEDGVPVKMPRFS